MYKGKTVFKNDVGSTLCGPKNLAPKAKNSSIFEALAQEVKNYM